MSNLKEILWTDPNSAPPKNYLWQKKDGIYTFTSSGWKRTKTFRTVDDYCDAEIPLIAKLTEGDYVNIADIPVGVIGCNPGWTKAPENVNCYGERAYRDKDVEIWYNATYIKIQ